MGCVPVLLMVAAIGVDFGWTPDGSGGVEYVIQIAPEKLDQVKDVGEISSTIAPEVRGHVSRVVVKVGEGPLVRETPPNLKQRAPSDSIGGADVSPGTNAAGRALATRRASSTVSHADFAQADYVPFPIPQIDDPYELAPVRPAASATELSLTGTQSGPAGEIEAVMKPDPQGQGYSLPGATSTRESGADAAASQSRHQLPAFTGGPAGATASSMVGSRPDAPSTAPTQRRDSDWYDAQQMPRRNELSRPSTDPQADSGTAAGGAYAHSGRSTPTGLSESSAQAGSTPPAGASSQVGTASRTERTPQASSAQPQGSSGPARSAQASPAQTRGGMAADPSGAAPPADAGLGTTSTFGQFPAGMRQISDASNPAASADYGRPTDQSAHTGPATSPRDRLAYQSNQSSQSNGASLGHPDQALHGSPAAPPGSVGQQRQATPYDRPSQQGYQGPYGNQTQYGNQGQHGNQTQYAAQGPYGNQGQQYGGMSSSDGSAAYGGSRTPAERNGYGSPSGLEPRIAGRDLTTDSSPRRETEQTTERSSAALTRSSSELSRAPEPPSERDLSAGAARTPISWADRSSDTGGKIPNEASVASQPLFNGLLLISFVANIYLFFWLKNLRLKFREMVATKRSASSKGVPA